MFLSEMLPYKRIVIQCHDAPDADAVGAGFALYRYFERRGCQTMLVYGGKYKAEKPNMLAMLHLLEIPLTYCESAPVCDLLITVDCQYGSGNVTKWEVPATAMIDHHRSMLPKNTSRCMIRSKYGSCCTLVWALLQEEGVDVNQDTAVATGLYYGLYMDTAHFSEISHPMDRDMRDSLHYQKNIFLQLINTNMTRAELTIFADAIRNYRLDEETQAALVPVQRCDPNVLGIVSDFIIQVSEIQICVAFMVNANGCKLSVRSCSEEVQAVDLVQYLCQNIGSGGGHAMKSGGFLSGLLFKAQQGNLDYGHYLRQAMGAYIARYQIIRAQTDVIDLSKMRHYVKKRCRLGVVCLTDLVRSGTPLLVRTLEGDLECISAEDLYVMVGIEGEVYPIQREKFMQTYTFCEGEPEYSSEYEPTVHNTITSEAYRLRDRMRTCCARGTSYIFAYPLEHCVKVFTQWDAHKYLKGEVGDYLAVRADDKQDIYIIQQDIFLRSYEPVKENHKLNR